MRKGALSEAVALIKAVSSALLAQPFTAASTAGAELRRACGDLSANAEAYIRAGALGDPMQACFAAAGDAGMTGDAFARVRGSLVTMQMRFNVGRAVQVMASRLALAAECSALADATMTSRGEVERVIARIRAAFEPVIDFAMDNAEPEAFKALSALYAAVVRDLTERGRSLPRMVGYDCARPLPALALAQRLYADADRAGELVLENDVSNPIFMPASGQALSR